MLLAVRAQGGHEAPRGRGLFPTQEIPPGAAQQAAAGVTGGGRWALREIVAKAAPAVAAATDGYQPFRFLVCARESQTPEKNPMAAAPE